MKVVGGVGGIEVVVTIWGIGIETVIDIEVGMIEETKKVLLTIGKKEKEAILVMKETIIKITIERKEILLKYVFFDNKIG